MQRKPEKRQANLHKNNRHLSQDESIIAYKREEFSGPFPPPDILKAYGEYDPSLPARIFNMTEEESKHRRRMESRIIGWQVKSYFVNNIFAILAICLVLAVGCFFMLEGYATQGAWIIGTTSIGIVSIIITRNFTKNTPPELPPE